MLLIGPLGADPNPFGFSVSFFLLPFFQRAFEAVRLGAGFQDVGLIGQPIQNRFAQAWIGKHLRPL